MKVFGVDISAKYIFFELDGKKYSVCFRDSLRKGVNDVSVWRENNETDAKITGTYPPLKIIVIELWRIWLPAWWKKIIKKYERSHNR